MKFREKRIDTPGLIAGAVALFAVTGGLIEAGQLGWRRSIPLALLVGGLLVGAVFLIVEWRQREPMLPLRLFRSRGFSAATAAGGIFNFCLYGALLCVSLFVQGPLGRPALESGLILLPLTVAVGIGAFLSGRLTAQFGPRVPMVIGYSAGAVGAALLILAGTSLFLVVLGSATLGFCSIAMPAMTSVVMSAVEPARTGLASGVLNTARQTGGALGAAVLGGLLTTSDNGAGTLLRVPMLAVIAAYVVAMSCTILCTGRRS